MVIHPRGARVRHPPDLAQFKRGISDTPLNSLHMSELFIPLMQPKNANAESMQFALACASWAHIIISWQLVIYEGPSGRVHVFQVHLERCGSRKQDQSDKAQQPTYPQTECVLKCMQRCCQTQTAHDPSFTLFFEPIASNWCTFGYKI